MQITKPYAATVVKILIAMMTTAAHAQQNAADQKLITEQDDRRIQSLDTGVMNTPEMVNTPKSFSLNDESTDNQTIFLTNEQELGAYPQLVFRGLLAALLNHNVQDVMFLLPIYQNQPMDNQDMMIVHWATGMIAEHQGQYQRAIEYYERASRDDRHIAALYFQLAIVLFNDKQFKEAERYFNQLLTLNLPSHVAEVVKAHLQAIHQYHQWQTYGGANFLQDKNINNAPDNHDLGGGWTAPQKQSATGAGLWAGVSKHWSLKNGWYAKTQAGTNAKYYWDNKRYNELTVTTSAGLGYHNARLELSALPFIEQSHYADGDERGQLSKFSTSKGLSLNTSYWLTPKWQGNLHTQIASQTYHTRPHLDGLARQTGITFVHTPNAKRYWFLGGEYHRTDTQDIEDSFIKRQIKTGISQSWDDWVVTASASFGKKSYRGAGFFGKIQHNQEKSLSASFEHRKIQLFGMTPRLTWQHQKVSSNIALYNYDKNHIFIQVNKRF